MYLQLAAMGSTARGAAHHGIDIAGASFALQAPHPVSACPRISGSPGAPAALRGCACRLLFKHPGEVTGPRACSPSFPPGVRAGPRAPPILFCPNAGRAALGRQAGKKGPRDPSRYSSSLLRGTTEPTLRSWDQPLVADPSSPEFGVFARPRASCRALFPFPAPKQPFWACFLWQRAHLGRFRCLRRLGCRLLRLARLGLGFRLFSRRQRARTRHHARQRVRMERR